MIARRKQRWSRASLVSVLLMFVISADASGKSPIPSDDAQAKMLTLLREVYKDEYSQAKTDEQKADLARKMIQKAAQTKDDPTSHYILLRVARDIAAQAGYADVAMQAVERLTATYQIDGQQMTLEVLKKAASSARTQKQHETAYRCVKPLVDTALASDRIEEAGEWMGLALNAARNSRNKDLLSEAVARNKEVQELVTICEKVKTAQHALESNPNDPEANLVVGKHLCFCKRDWAGGLGRLVKGGDETLRIIAEKDLAFPDGADKQVELADEWWEHAAKTTLSESEASRQRASYWYGKARPSLKGLLRDKVDRRLEEASKSLSDASTQVTTMSSNVKLHEPPNERSQQRGLADGTFLVFDGKGFDGWGVCDPRTIDQVVEVNAANKSLVFKQNAAIYRAVPDAPNHFVMHLEFRYRPNQFLYVFPASGRAIRFQIGMSGLMTGVFKAGKRGSVSQSKDGTLSVAVNPLRASEQPAGRWNVAEITHTENHWTVKMNGVLINETDDEGPAPSTVCLLAEPGVEVKNIWVKRLGQ